MMTNASARSANASQANRQLDNETITVDGTIYRRANVSYRISQQGGQKALGSLVDGGANGGVCGSDARMMEASCD